MSTRYQFSIEVVRTDDRAPPGLQSYHVEVDERGLVHYKVFIIGDVAEPPTEKVLREKTRDITGFPLPGGKCKRPGE